MRLRLSARLAASRFASGRCGKTRGAPETWLRIALRWRQKRKQTENVRTVRAATPPAVAITTTTVKTNASFAHTHLHFAARASDRTVYERFLRTVSRTRTHLFVHQSPLPSGERARVRGGTATTPVRDVLRIERTGFMTTTHTATFAMHPRRANRPPRVVHPEIAAISKVAAASPAERSPRIRIPIPIPTTVRPAAALRPHPLFERPGKTARRNERLPSPERPQRMHSRELRVFRLLHAESVERPAPRRAPESRLVPPAPPARAPELVWRTTPRVQPETAGGSTDNAPLSMSRPPLRSAAPQETAPETARRAARGALKMSDFDPALLDRLTDDVIRRVERRARIERERRGL